MVKFGDVGMRLNEGWVSYHGDEVWGFINTNVRTTS